MNDHTGIVLSLAFLLFFRRVFIGPVGAVAFGAPYSVVQHLRSPHGLVPIPIQILAGDFIYRVHEIISSRMFEAITFKVHVLSLAHFLLSNDVFQREQYEGCFAVGDPAVGIEGQKLPAPAGHRIVFGHADVTDSVGSAFARGSDPRVQDVHIAAV